MAPTAKHHDTGGSLKRLHEICLAFPSATEKEAWGECTFRVGGKMFAMTGNDHHDSGRVAVWIKAIPFVQEIFINSDPARFFKPPYVGHKGWIGARLDVKVDWGMLAELIKDAYLMTAPKKLAGAARPAPAKARRAKSVRARKPRH